MSKLLVVVDMQVDFVNGSLGTKEAVSIVPNVVNKIEEYKASGDEVVFTLDTHDETYLDTLEGKKLPVVHCVKGTPGWELASELKKFEGTRFEKPGFGSVGLLHYLAGKNYESVELIGLCTDICVISNALLIKAALINTPIIVDQNCCAGVTPKSHRNALEAMKVCQVELIG